MKVAIRLALILAIGMPVVCNSQEAKPKGDGKPSSATHGPQSNPDATKRFPFALKSLHAPTSNPEPASDVADRRAKEFTDRWTIRLTAIIALAAVLQFWGIIGQIFVYKKQARIMGAQLGAAQVAANAARDGVAVAKSSAIAVNRAYVGFDGGIIVPSFDAPTGVVNGFRILISVKNGGETPTRKVAGSGTLQPLPIEPDQGFDYSLQSWKFWPEISPKEVRHFDAPLFFPSAWQRFTNHSFPYYFWGWVEYYDVFDSSDRHRTEFCFKLNISGTLENRRYSISLTPIGPHNATDKDCIYEAQTHWP